MSQKKSTPTSKQDSLKRSISSRITYYCICNYAIEYVVTNSDVSMPTHVYLSIYKILSVIDSLGTRLISQCRKSQHKPTDHNVVNPKVKSVI